MGRWPSLVLFEWLRKYLPIDRRIKKSTAIDRLPNWLAAGFAFASHPSPVLERKLCNLIRSLRGSVLAVFKTVSTFQQLLFWPKSWRNITAGRKQRCRPSSDLRMPNNNNKQPHTHLHINTPGWSTVCNEIDWTSFFFLTWERCSLAFLVADLNFTTQFYLSLGWAFSTFSPTSLYIGGGEGGLRLSRFVCWRV